MPIHHEIAYVHDVRALGGRILPAARYTCPEHKADHAQRHKDNDLYSSHSLPFRSQRKTGGRLRKMSAAGAAALPQIAPSAASLRSGLELLND
jgi:hypothetical protein